MNDSYIFEAITSEALTQSLSSEGLVIILNIRIPEYMPKFPGYFFLVILFGETINYESKRGK